MVGDRGAAALCERPIHLALLFGDSGATHHFKVSGFILEVAGDRHNVVHKKDIAGSQLSSR